MPQGLLLHPALAAAVANFSHLPATRMQMETKFQVFEWQRVLLGETPPPYYLEIALKCVFVFLILLLVVRLLGKRGQQNLSPMQQMLMIALGSAAGDALLYPGVAVGHAALILVGITMLTIGMENLAERARPVRDYLESRPRVLVRDGVVDIEAMFKERTTRRELYAELRVKGACSLSQVRYAILEVTGDISVFLHEGPPKGDDLLEYVVDGEKYDPPA